MALPKFKISYNGYKSYEAEEVSALEHQVAGEWIEFYDGSGLVLRVRDAWVDRVERVA